MLLCLKTWEGFFLEYINSADEDGLELVKTSSQGPISFIVILFYGMRREKYFNNIGGNIKHKVRKNIFWRSQCKDSARPFLCFMKTFF